MPTLFQLLPSWIKRPLRITLYGVLDTWDGITGSREPMVPPRMTALVVGAGDFKKPGRSFLTIWSTTPVLSPSIASLKLELAMAAWR